MSALLNTLPGDITSLLRDFSPVRYAGVRGVILERGALTCAVSVQRPNGSMSVPCPLGMGDLRLDLTDPTGRAHAAAWLHTKRGELALLDADQAAMRLCDVIGRFEDMTPTQIDTLARLVLRLAGRTP